MLAVLQIVRKCPLPLSPLCQDWNSQLTSAWLNIWTQKYIDSCIPNSSPEKSSDQKHKTRGELSLEIHRWRTFKFVKHYREIWDMSVIFCANIFSSELFCRCSKWEHIGKKKNRRNQIIYNYVCVGGTGAAIWDTNG